MSDENDRAKSTNVPHDQQTEGYGGGHIEARHGRVDVWLLIVYVIMLVWSLYYGIKYWGGLGPGLEF